MPQQRPADQSPKKKLRSYVRIAVKLHGQSSLFQSFSPPPCIFIHGTDKVEGSLMVLFFDLAFFIGPLGNFSADAGRITVNYLVGYW